MEIEICAAAGGVRDIPVLGAPFCTKAAEQLSSHLQGF